MRLTSEVKRNKLYAAFLSGCSQREAARLAGVSKGTALFHLRLFGGRAHFESQGTKFKQNQWK